MTAAITTPASIANFQDFAAILHQEARAAAACFGLPASADLAASIVDRISQRCGGREVYVPKRAGRTQSAITHAQIRARFNGSNLADLAREAGKSERQIRRIVQSDGRS